MHEHGATRRRIRPAFLCWETTPDVVPDQVTHAADAGRPVTLCGEPVGAQGGPWPADAPAGRLWCAACTVAVYGPERASR